jgi:hypothetical protein
MRIARAVTRRGGGRESRSPRKRSPKPPGPVDTSTAAKPAHSASGAVVHAGTMRMGLPHELPDPGRVEAVSLGVRWHHLRHRRPHPPPLGSESFDAVVAVYILIQRARCPATPVIEAVADALVDGGVLLATQGWEAWTGSDSTWRGGGPEMW